MNKIIGFIELIVPNIKFNGIKTTLLFCYFYFFFKFFPPQKNSTKLFGFTFHFAAPDSHYNLLMEHFGMNQYFFKTDKKNPVILDIGANIGDSVLYFKWLYTHSKIFAFEPQTDAFRLLEKNISINKFTDVVPYNIALSNRNGKTKLYSQNNNVFETATLAHELSKTYKDVHVDTIERKQIRTIPEIMKLPQIDLIKIDTEGSETTVLEDLAPLLARTKKIIIEYHLAAGTHNSFDAIIELLNKHNLTPSIFSHARTTDNATNPFVFFISALKSYATN